MADIFISYAKEDRKVAEKLYDLLTGQWTVWWDDDVIDEFHREIEREIAKAGCILSLFSKSSREKATVIDELNLGRHLNKKIIPIKLDESKPPYSFGTLSSVDMCDWQGSTNHLGFKLLHKRIVNVIPPSAALKRPNRIANGKLPLPSLFMSVSSHETQLVPSDAVKILSICKVPTILVSAYDLVSHREPDNLIKEIRKFRNKGGFVLIDSGNYEASRLSDKSWSAEHLKEVLKSTPHDWAFCFDNLEPSLGKNRCVKDVVDTIERDQAHTNSPVLPIVHAPKLNAGGYKLDDFPEIVRRISEKLNPELIAVPERELGAGLIARAETVMSIRNELNKLPFYQPIHLLGTGNPWSIAVLSAAGADTFDGLEWCRFAINTESEIEAINHFHHFDLISGLSESKIGFAGEVAIHNLNYFNSFGDIMRSMSKEAFVQGVIGKKAFFKLKFGLPELFK